MAPFLRAGHISSQCFEKQHGIPRGFVCRRINHALIGYCVPVTHRWLQVHWWDKARPKDPRFELPAVRSTRTKCECRLVVGVPNPPVCIRTDKKGHVRTLKIKFLQSTSEFGGSRKHEKTQHELAGLGSAALAAAVASLLR